MYSLYYFLQECIFNIFNEHVSNKTSQSNKTDRHKNGWFSEKVELIKLVTDHQCPLQISRNRPSSGIPRMQKIAFAAYSSRRLSIEFHASALFVQLFKISHSRNEYRYFDTP